MDSTFKKNYSPLRKIILIVLVIAVHGAVWAFVNKYNSIRSSKDLHDLTTSFDSLFPYLGWSWFLYYFGHVYVVGGSSIAIWNYDRHNFDKIIFLFCMMIISGGIIQLALPAKSPLPDQMGFVHKWIHQNISNDPYVCFPSMHVSLAALPTFLLIKKNKFSLIKIALIITLSLIFISTLILKEHFFIDAAAGLFLAYFFYILFSAEVF
ncbi:MAG TPA: phosphatase PAP2 family protein [Ignavibacteriaceae bacterium]|nr:phosphatase PAP2 family protein [Ignavibacteriaceae bacterium]